MYEHLLCEVYRCFSFERVSRVLQHAPGCVVPAIGGQNLIKTSHLTPQSRCHCCSLFIIFSFKYLAMRQYWMDICHRLLFKKWFKDFLSFVHKIIITVGDKIKKSWLSVRQPLGQSWAKCGLFAAAALRSKFSFFLLKKIGPHGLQSLPFLILLMQFPVLRQAWVKRLCSIT